MAWRMLGREDMKVRWAELLIQKKICSWGEVASFLCSSLAGICVLGKRSVTPWRRRRSRGSLDDLNLSCSLCTVVRVD